MGVLHAWHGVSDTGIGDPVPEKQCARIGPASGQSFHRHHDVELAVRGFDVVMCGQRALDIRPCGGTNDPERFRIVLDPHQRADGEGGWPVSGGRN